MTPTIVLSLDAQTQKLGIQTKLNKKDSVAVLLEAVKMLVNADEEQGPKIVPAVLMPRMPH